MKFLARDIFVLSFLLIMQVVMLNLLIAMLSDTYQRVKADADLEWILLSHKIKLQYVASITSIWMLPPLNVVRTLVMAMLWLFSVPARGLRGLIRCSGRCNLPFAHAIDEVELSARYGKRRSIYLLPELQKLTLPLLRLERYEPSRVIRLEGEPSTFGTLYQLPGQPSVPFFPCRCAFISRGV